MKRKNKAARTINTALGFIVIITVILFSPLFGYARGFASKEQREAAASAQSVVSAPSVWTAAAATPRPTAPPMPTPVVLPTAPPTPEPTPVPQRAPQYVQQPAAVQQPVYSTWTQDEYQAPEEEYAEQWSEQESEQEDAGISVSEEQQQDDTGGEITIGDGGAAVQGDDADLVINIPGFGDGQSDAISIAISGGDDVGVQQPIQDKGEGEPFSIG